MTVGFDLISDLNLTPDDSFNWGGKAESLYCLIAGNISNDLATIRQTLTHLSHFYQGVFYTSGTLEYENVDDLHERDAELAAACDGIKNVSLLYNHVVIIDGIAILGANGWYGPYADNQISREIKQTEDVSYLGKSIERLQLHNDVKKIILVTHSVPNPELYFGEEDMAVYDQMPPALCLACDTMKKVSHWVYGNYNKTVDTTINQINYVNNARYDRLPYYGKRINA